MAVLLLPQPACAVLKEANLKQTLAILREEITERHQEIQQETAKRQQINDNIRKQVRTIIQRSSQNGLMLYSQKQDYIFDLTYACHEATELYHDYGSTVRPFNKVLGQLNSEINRYDSLIVVLQKMPVMVLDDKSRTDRNVCLTLATDLKKQLTEQAEDIIKYQQFFDNVGANLKEMNDYAIEKYNTIQSSIFVNGDETYFSILSSLGQHIKDTSESVAEKYKPKKHSISQWDGRIVFGLFLMIAFYALLALGLNVLFFRYVLPKKYQNEEFLKKRPCITLATSVVTFAIILGILKAFVSQSFFQMASSLLVEYAWLLGVILISMLLRMNGDEIKSGFKIYTPIIVMSFIVIAFRIILIPNELVNLIFPPILLLCALWQWHVIRKYDDKTPRSDTFYTYITLTIFVISVVCSWMGYTLLSVQLLIWWVMELTCIQSITCLLFWLKIYEEKHDIENAKLAKKWFYNLMTQVIVPVLGVVTFLFSIYWAADVFNLTDMTWKVFNYQFVDEPNIKISILRLAIVIILYFVFRYFSRLCKTLLKEQLQKSGGDNWRSKDMMGKNIIQILIWGTFLFLALSILHIGNKWLMVIAGGLSTGIGFAMKDILENIYYGISLMTGRIHIGDTILCDGVLGTVKSISYTSTMVEVEDGSVMAFQNSQLFTKNYKNLTKNHGWELTVIPVGVSYGTNIPKVREWLTEECSKLDCFDKSKGVKVYFAGFGDSSVDLKVKCWIDVRNRYVANSKIHECIYDTLNKHGVEIPFPQRDLHVITDNAEQK